MDSDVASGHVLRAVTAEHDGPSGVTDNDRDGIGWAISRNRRGPASVTVTVKRAPPVPSHRPVPDHVAVMPLTTKDVTVSPGNRWPGVCSSSWPRNVAPDGAATNPNECRAPPMSNVPPPVTFFAAVMARLRCRPWPCRGSVIVEDCDCDEAAEHGAVDVGSAAGAGRTGTVAPVDRAGVRVVGPGVRERRGHRNGGTDGEDGPPTGAVIVTAGAALVTVSVNMSITVGPVPSDTDNVTT